MDGIILLSKQPGLTSFTSLHQIKRAIKSTKVGHTGTLDSFAQGLLVVCTGRLTRLAGSITEFDKSYKAVIKFGQETDTLDYEGKIVNQTELPSTEKLKEVIKTFIGEQMQVPPTFSAIHVDGQRASELARQGKEAELPPRKITVYSAELQDMLLNENGKVIACLAEFTVSKGTYIRSLARDIGKKTNSSAHLVGLYRTRVGNFKIEDSAFYDELPYFTIKNCLKFSEKRKIQIKKEAEEREIAKQNKQKREKPVYDAQKDQLVYDKILQKVQVVTEELAVSCGFNLVHLNSDLAYDDFMNGRPLKNRLFVEDLYKIPNNTMNAVFGPNKVFAGLISKDEVGKIRYKLVIN